MTPFAPFVRFADISPAGGITLKGKALAGDRKGRPYKAGDRKGRPYEEVTQK